MSIGSKNSASKSLASKTYACRTLGSSGPTVFPLGLGCAGLSRPVGQASEDAESIATIHEAIERGINVIDTADFYGGGQNEMLISKAIRGRRDKVVLSVKFGGLRSPDGALWAWTPDRRR